MLGIARLIELHAHISWHLEVSHESITLIGDLLGELDAATAQLGDGLFDVVAIERDVMSS